MVGWQPVVLPCFAVGGTTKRWSPYPDPGAQFILLWPRPYEVEPLGVCTTWRANHAVHGRVLLDDDGNVHTGSVVF